ncbi:MAG: lipase maturation factor family protein [Polyangiales bacterium]
MTEYFEGLWLVRLLVQRGLAAIYLLAFTSALCQFRPLLGERGLLPAPRLLAQSTFRALPSVFHAHYSDRFFARVAWSGIALSLVALSGLSEAGPLWLSMLVWLALWALYMSIVNVGQTFYGFGWESMLLEAGFFAAFLGPAQLAPSAIPIVILRWMLFRVELGAGLIKLRHDSCWRDLTCLYYHYETQPIPNPLSWHFHRIPKPLQRLSVLFSHFVQLVAPFGLLLPQPFASIAGVLIIGHQLLLVISGNYSWLNWLTIVLGFSAFGDAQLRLVLPVEAPEIFERSLANDVMLYALAVVTGFLSIEPARNFFSPNQLMNYSYNALHLVNVYGAFGSVTRERYEIVLEGSSAHAGDDDWRPYEFKGKPGDPTRRPRQIAPYHLRLDWLMWFLPLAAVVTSDGVYARRVERWFITLVQRLLEGDRATLALLGRNPFPDTPPLRVRARFFRYQFADASERAKTGAWWTRTEVGPYMTPITLAEIATAR